MEQVLPLGRKSNPRVQAVIGLEFSRATIIIRKEA